MNSDLVLAHYPNSMTILPTYRCTAACKECCFESSPEVKGRLSLDEIEHAIDSAKESFPALKMVVFSGGECFTLKEDLYSSIEKASRLGLATRCVSNGYWGKSLDNAHSVAKKIAKAGLNEINFSTGLDHSQFVTLQSVINAALACIEHGITTLIIVEKDSESSEVLNDLYNHPDFGKISASSLLTVKSNAWMPFKQDFESRGDQSSGPNLNEGCSQVFENIVVTPHNLVSACCGLTHEHIPEMKIGDLEHDSIGAAFNNQLEDFLKYWIKVEGPMNIIRQLCDEDFITREVGQIDHICQACVHLHKNPVIREKLASEYHNHVNQVMAKFHLELSAKGIENHFLVA
ncbi:radical SAM protein [Pseudoalteromonas rubra]|uniref:Radical SAM protein n=1 Tax=Pseudoalteromonas rubra TaxID=43658 RepID=A0A4Q7EC57_9GAMM|nr:radical SAM protein [Pseudoalteromonas rubra]RZM80322.1 radical SAM protein [Pseudoalteromonas rubra]